MIARSTLIKYVSVLHISLIFTACENPFQIKDKGEYKIVFEEDLSLYSVNLDGSDLTKIHDLEATPFQISWSPDAKKILIDLYGVNYAILNADGSEYKVLNYHPALQASWLDNEEIIFSYSDTVFTLNINSEALKKISRGRTPNISPDKTKIALVQDDHELYVMDADGSNAIKLADSVSLYGLAWSPDGSEIAFQKNYSLWKISLDNKQADKLTSTELLISGNLSWSPSGSMILCSVRNDDSGYSPLLVTVNGDSYKILSEDIKVPQWLPKPGSNYIIYYSSEEKKIMRMNFDGSNAAQIASRTKPGIYSFTISPVPL